MRVVVGAVFVVVAGIVALEIVMRPSDADRLEAALLFAAMAVITIVATGAVRALAGRSRSLGHVVGVVGVIAAGLIALAVAAGAWQMFLSVHDLHLIAIVVAVAAGLSIVFALGITRSMRDDLAAIRRTTDHVAAGDLSARTGVRRADELGAAAAALDELISALENAEVQRRRDDEARRGLLTSVGHDLRSPLAALQAAVEALQDGLAPDTERYLRSMSRDVAHLRALVDDLFLLARLESGDLTLDRQRLDLAELADETIEAMEPVARQERVGLRLDADGRATVVGGPEVLGRVLRNLVDNAIRYAPAASDVVVQVRSGDGATVEVIDAGPGFDPALVSSAFETFVRGDPARSRGNGGAGLGLAIAKGVVEAYGGSIWAAPGPGGRVGFTLPAVAEGSLEPLER